MSTNDCMLIDKEQLAIMSNDVGMHLRGIIETFREETRDRLVVMRHHLQNGDRSALANEAHAIKGTAATIGLAKLASDAKSLEHGAGTMNSGEMAAQVRLIQRCFYESCAALVELGHLSSFGSGAH